MWAREKAPGSQDSYVYDRNKVARYITKTNNLKSIEPIAQMYPEKDPNTVYKAPTRFHTTDKYFALRNDLIFSIESINSEYMSQIYRAGSTSAQGTKFEWKGHYQSTLPVDFGINVNWNQGTWSDEKIGQASWSSVFFGPINSVLFGGTPGISDWTIYGSLQRSLFHRSEKDPDQHSFSTTAVQLDLIKAFESDWALSRRGWLSRLEIQYQEFHRVPSAGS